MLIQYINNIYVSSINDSMNVDIYKKYNINIVINCTNDKNFINLKNIKNVRIPLSNDLNIHTDILLLNNNIDKILKFINDNYINNIILITGIDENNIPSLIVSLFLVKYSEISIYDIKNILKSKNKNLCIDYDLSIFNLHH